MCSAVDDTIQQPSGDPLGISFDAKDISLSDVLEGILSVPES
ncbi:hypothetical protein ACTVCO_12135 [Sanguibacter sp. A247]